MHWNVGRIGIVVRCWDKVWGRIGRFYTLMVLAAVLFDKPAFQNLISNGLVLAEDGKKMSKRLKNYPPPTDIIDEYGAVSCFLHPQNSGVCFQEGISLLLLAGGLKLFCFDGCRMLWDCIWSILLRWRESHWGSRKMVYMLWYVSGSIHIQSVTIWCTERLMILRRCFLHCPVGVLLVIWNPFCFSDCKRDWQEHAIASFFEDS